MRSGPGASQYSEVMVRGHRQAYGGPTMMGAKLLDFIFRLVKEPEILI
jgi:hypothetical protein